MKLSGLLPKLQKIAYLLLATVFLVLSQASLVKAANQLNPCDLDSLYKDSVWYNGCTNFTSCGDSASLDAFLQALAGHESGGDPIAENGPPPAASGKYQYLDPTWQDHLKTYYDASLGSQYARAKDAPEAVQDALAYLEYTNKAIQYKGDVAKMAVSHIYPAVADDPSKWPTEKIGSNPTALEYAQDIVKRITTGSDSKIKLLYSQAPNFQQYLAKQGTAPPLVIDNSELGGSGTTTISGSSSGACACGGSNSTPPGSAGNTIVIDPGHGPNFSQVDAATGLNMIESDNSPEISEVWDVAQIVKTKLSADGYNVLLTKQDEAGIGVTFRDRANVANSNSAALALSIHDDHSGGRTFSNFREIYDQRVGLSRGSGANKTTFTDAAVAQKSQDFAKIFQQERQKAEGAAPNITKADFSNRAPVEPGDITMVQLFSKVPWVYNEVGATGNLTAAQEQQYGTGLINAVEKAVPLSGSSGSSSVTPTGCTGVQAILHYIQLYAWPDFEGQDSYDASAGKYVKAKPEYLAALQAAVVAGKYVGDQTYLGADCGGFTTRVMQDSGADPNYGGGGNTVYQQKWMDDHPQLYQKLGDASGGDAVQQLHLQPGDIAVNADHTFFYVGNAIPGWGGDTASASQADRTAMASHGDSRTFSWYRYIGGGGS